VILSAPDSDPNQFFESGSCKKVRILSDPALDPDLQHWFKINRGIEVRFAFVSIAMLSLVFTHLFGHKISTY
jgi:hypothetical protein